MTDWDAQLKFDLGKYMDQVELNEKASEHALEIIETSSCLEINQMYRNLFDAFAPTIQDAKNRLFEYFRDEYVENFGYDDTEHDYAGCED
jgi:hypothetical protein